MVFDIVFRHGNDIYSTTEVLVSNSENRRESHNVELITVKSNERIKFDFTNPEQKRNYEFLACSFLTQYSPKSRMPIVYNENSILNTLRYSHKIRVACPVRSISNEKEFNRIHPSAVSIYNVLTDKFGFKKNDIHFELTEYKSYNDIRKPVSYLFEKNKTIAYPYFLAVIPKLANRSEGVFAEIFYRIGRKYPVIIFYEHREALSYVLRSLRENQQISNVKYQECEIENIAEYLKEDPSILFSLDI